MLHKISGYIKWLLPVLFVAYYSNISIFLHTHFEGDEVVVHAHPFSKSRDGAPHQHKSLAEILLIHNLSVIHASDGAIHTLQLKPFSGELKETMECLLYSEYVSSFSGALFLRAPPTLPVYVLC